MVLYPLFIINTFISSAEVLIFKNHTLLILDNLMAAELRDHFWKEVASFKSPPPRETAPVPELGEDAREHADSKLKLPKDKPTIIVFLRHCGCPCKPRQPNQPA